MKEFMKSTLLWKIPVIPYCPALRQLCTAGSWLCLNQGAGWTKEKQERMRWITDENSRF